MLTHRVPYPPDRGDRIRAYHLLRHLAAHVDVSLACVSDEPVTDDQRAVLADLTAQLAIQPIGPAWSRARGVAALAAGRAVTPAIFYRRSLARRVASWHHHMPFDAVLTFCTGMVGYAMDLQRGPHRPRHVLDLVDVDSLKWARFAAESKPPMRWVYAAEARRLAPIERGGEWVDAITVISDNEARAYRHEIGLAANLHVVENGVDADFFRPLPDCPRAGDTPTITFVGVLDYKPNIDGVAWFAREVLPDVLRRQPRARLRIVGRNPAPAVRALGQVRGVDVIGPVPDVRTHLAESAVVIAPLLIAPGVQNKVLEAMASARAVVCTPAAAAGIDAVTNIHLLTADDASTFAYHVARLLGDTTKRTAVAAAARRRIEERYAWGRALAPMLDLITGRAPLAAACPSRRPQPLAA